MQAAARTFANVILDNAKLSRNIAGTRCFRHCIASLNSAHRIDKQLGKSEVAIKLQLTS